MNKNPATLLLFVLLTTSLLAQKPADVVLNSATNIGVHKATISWTKYTGTDFHEYRLYRDTSSGVDTSSSGKKIITNSGTVSIEDSLLHSAQNYYYKIYVVNSSGVFSDGSNVIQFTTHANDYPFSDDLEDSPEMSWFTEGTWGLTNSSASSGTNSFADSPEGNYSNNNSSSVLLHINLATAIMPQLSFNTRFAFEANYDFGRVEVSADGNNWTIVGYWTGSLSSWEEKHIDLTPWQGIADLIIRWRVTTNSSGVSDGWYIDDIRVKESDVTNINFPFVENFDDTSSSKNWHFSQWEIVSVGMDFSMGVHDSPSGSYLASGGTGSSDNPNSFTALTTSGVIDLSNAVDPVLTFNQKYELWGTTSADRPEHDYGRVYISSSYGQPGTWKQLYAINGTGHSVDWQKVEIDLSDYKLPNIRFRFVVDDQRDQNSGWNGDQSAVSDGWWLDDIRIENRPTSISDLSIHNVSMHGATLTWTPNTDSDFLQYKIFRSTKQDFSGDSELIATIADQNTFQFRDDYQVLQPNKYFYRMYTVDSLETISKSSNIVSADYTVPTVDFPFTDSVEIAQDTINWAWSFPWGRTTAKAHSGNTAWTDSPGASYSTNANTALTTYINLSGSSSPILEFWQLYSFETNQDFGYVQISNDNGNTWSTIYSVTGVDPNWSKSRIDLSAYVGSTIGIRFLVTSNNSSNNDGWYLDDISVQEGVKIAGYPFFEDFESGFDRWFNDNPWGISNTSVHSGSNSMSDSPAGTYANSTSSSLSLHIDLSSSRMPMLEFWAKFATEVNYDYCRVEVSNDGSSWTVVGYWTGSQSEWKINHIDLTPWQGNSDVTVRWRLTSDLSSVSDGWYIDDIKIAETPVTALSYPFYENFDDSSFYSNWHSAQWEIIADGLSLPGRVHDSPKGNYLNSGGSGSSDNPNSFTALTTAGVIDLSSAVDPVMTFYHKFDLWESTGGDRPEHDYGRIYVSTNYGLPGTWQEIYTVGGIDNTAEWSKVEVDLSAYIAQNVRFRFVVDDQRDQNTGWNGDQSVVRDGWWIDNLRIENRPTTPSLHPLTNVSIGGATISWTKNTDNDFKQYELYRASTEDVSRSSELIAVITTQNITSYRDNHQLLQPNHYWYRLYSVDSLLTPSKGSNIVKSVYSIPENSFPFYDDVSQNSDTIWAASSPWNRTNRTSHSGNESWTDSPNSSYGANTNTALTMNVKLAGSNTPVLTFWQKYSLEQSADFGYVEVSSDGGITWSIVHSVTGIDTAWNQERISLSNYIGSTIGLRFRMTSDAANQLDGWYIDDIKIEDGKQIAGYPFSDDVESGIANWFADSPWGLSKVNPHGGEFCWTDSPAGSYSNNSNSSLTLHINLTTAQMPMLSFYTRYATEVNYDYCRVEVSSDGSYWTVAGYWSGSHSIWSKIKIDLTPWQGNSDVRIRWRFTSNSSVMSDGWYIDDIVINETETPHLAFPFLDSFEDSSSNDKWHFSQWAIVPEGYNSEGRVHDSPTGYYLPSGGSGSSDNPNSFSAFTSSGVFDLSKASSPVLTFYQKYDLWYSTSGDQPEHDYARIYISTNYGLPGTWTQIYNVTGPGHTTDWQKVTVDLSPYKLPNVRIRFVLDDQRDQNPGWNGDQSHVRDGWWLDDIAIYDNFSAQKIPDEVLLENPTAVASIPSVPTERIFGSVSEAGVTDIAGKNPSIIAEAGYGPDGSIPDDSTWIWFPANYLEDAGGFDRYYSHLTADSLGIYDYCFRFKLEDGNWVFADADGVDLGRGGFNGYSPKSAGDFLVTLEPQMDINASEISLSLPVNKIESREIQIHNSGKGVLRVNLAQIDSTGNLKAYSWFSFLSRTKNVEPNKSAALGITIDPTGVSPDSTYKGYILITSNDPANDSLIIKLTLNALPEGEPSIAGFIKDAGGNNIGQTAEIYLFSSGQLLSTLISGTKGYFAFYGIQPGDYQLKILSEGFYPANFQNVSIPAKGAMQINLGKVPSVIPTPDWIDFYGNASTFNSKPISKGDVISVRDPDGVLCGYFTVKEPGKYGIMHVYGDDKSTPFLDEGADEGDSLYFFINDFPAAASVPAIWTGGPTKLELTAISQDILSLHAGYNLISFTSFPADAVIKNAFASIDGKYTMVQGFDLGWGGGATYIDSLAGLGFNDLTEVDPMHGYWIYMLQEAQLNVYGAKLHDDAPLHLKSGWNLISYLPEFSDSVSQMLASISPFYSVVNGFDEFGAHTFVPGSKFNDLFEMRNGYGYWIKINESSDLIYRINRSPLKNNNGFTNENIISQNDIKPTPYWIDFYGKINVNLVAINQGELLSVYDPQGVKCGEFVIKQQGQYGLLHVYGDDPLTESIDEGAVEGDHLEFRIDGTPVSLANSDLTVWKSNRRAVRLDFDLVTNVEGRLTSAIPDEYDLKPNYPNPFNATTNIKFQLPKSGYVEVAIYNLLGETQAVLVSGEREAGFYDVVWNGKDSAGKNSASGVYFCRMISNGFVKIQKLILLK